MTPDMRIHNKGRPPNKVKWKKRMCNVLHEIKGPVSSRELAETSHVAIKYVRVWMTTLKKLNYLSTFKVNYYDRDFVYSGKYNMWTLYPDVSMDMLTEALR